MQFYILVMFVTLVKAGVIDTHPKCISIRGTNYEEEILKTDVHNPYQLAIDYDTNTLFFSYTAETTDIFAIAYLSLKTNNYGLVSGIRGGFANAVNRKSHEVYMGGNDGLYIFDYNTKSASKLTTKTNANIWQMFYKDALYFTTYYPHEKAYMYKDGAVLEIPELKGLVMMLAVKNNGNYVFSNSSGLFTYDKSTDKVYNIGTYILNGITADIDGNIYFSTPSGIYYIDDKLNKIEELFTSEDIYGLVIESNGNIICAKENSIVRLIPTKMECFDNNINKFNVIQLNAL